MSFELTMPFKKSVLGIIFLLLLSAVHAADNPDRPDYIQEFQQRISSAEEAFAQGVASTVEQAKAANTLVRVLEDELADALRQLSSGMDIEQFEGLEDSQKLWRQHYEKESAWINDHYSRQRVGSSYVAARAASKTLLLKQRVEQLLQYLKGLP